MESVAKLLDLAWFTMTALSVVCLLTFDLRQHRKAGRIRRVLVILIALFILYPSLSTRDDLLGLAFLSQRGSQRNQPALESQAASDCQLGTHLSALDHFLGAFFQNQEMNIRFAASAPPANSRSMEYLPARQASRAPPLV